MTAIDVDVAPSGPPPVATRHDHQGLVVTTIERPAPDVIATCRSLYTALVLDHLGKHGCMTSDMKPVWSGAFLCGPAITCLGADWRIRSMAADLAEPGDVIVLAAGGIKERACFGDMTATCWKSKEIEGVVIDGAARDVAYSEINDAQKQSSRFREQLGEKEAGAAEFVEDDPDYVEALAYGMPPTAGLGLGVDRLAMILTGRDTIRDVILFPTLKELT